MSHQFLLIRINRELRRIPLSEIVYMESKGKKIHLACIDKEYEYYGCIRDESMRLDDRFFNCHKWLSINMDNVTGIIDQNINFVNGIDKHIGIHNLCKAKKAFKNYLENEMWGQGEKKSYNVTENSNYN